jgi:hypothetical protein
MSITQTRLCDRCEAVIPGEEYASVQIEWGKDDSEIDLCQGCRLAFRVFLRGADQRSEGLCVARTRYGETCQRKNLHEGDHVYTSPADGASFSWSDERKR